MRFKSLKKRIAAYLVMVFVAIMGITAVASGFIGLPGLDRDLEIADADERSWVRNRTEGGDDPDLMANLSDDVLDNQREMRVFNDNDRVQLMVRMHDECLVTMYLATDRALTFQQFLGTRTARTARENMQRRQREAFSRAAVSVDAEMVYSFTSLINAFSMSIYYRDRAAATNIVTRAGATGTMVSSYVELLEAQPMNATRPPVVDNVDALDGLLDPTGIFRIPEIDGNVMQGEGMVIAVIDSGLDYDHHMFSTENLPHIWCNETNSYIIDLDRLAMRLCDVTGQLLMRDTPIDFNHLFARAVQMSNLTPQHTFRNHKVPFVFDHVDGTHHVNTANDNSHGTHVSGIIVGNTPPSHRVDASGVRYDHAYQGNIAGVEPERVALVAARNRELRFRYVLDETREGNIMLDHFGRNIYAVRGVTPLAQIVNLKVFSDFGETPDVSILAAVHDAAILGVDVMNLSLGAIFGHSNFDDDDFAAQVYRNVHELGISLIVATGNSATAMTGGHFGTNLASSPDSGAAGTPASLHESFAVASMEGIKAPYMMLATMTQEVGVAYFTEMGRPNGDTLDFVSDIRLAWEALLFNLDEFGRTIPNPNTARPGNEFGGTNPDGLDTDGLAWGMNFAGQPGQDGWGPITANSPANAWWRAFAPNTDSGVALRTQAALYYDTVTGEMRIPFTRAGRGFSDEFTGQVFDGRIALIERGLNTFTEKLENAQANRAIGAIIHNHLAGTIRMSVEEHVTIPGATISLDAHANLRGHNMGYFIIHPDFLGGPFMSGFTSWGVTPDLVLNPDITGHGGQILSAHPGERYARNSGTSMAAPNIAGIALVYRQYLTNPANNYENARRFNLINPANDRPCPNKVQIHIYRMMQSTAVMPRDQHNNPYSPRRVGAGLGNIRNMLRSESWIEVPEYEPITWRRVGGQRQSWSHTDDGVSSYRARMTERVFNDVLNAYEDVQVFSTRSAMNLFDDPMRTGIYYLEFDIVNVGDSILRFRPEAQVFTETLALHPQFDIIAERATMLYNTMDGVQFSIIDGANRTPLTNYVEVAASSRTTIAVRIQLDNTTVLGNDTNIHEAAGMTEKEWIIDTFENGIFVEGFIRMYAVDALGQDIDDAVNLSVPYLAFFGDWTDAPVFEYSIYEIDRYERMAIPPHDRLRNQTMLPTQAFGRHIEQDNDFTIPMGSFLFNNPRQFDNDIPLATESRTSLSLGQGGMHQIAFVGGFLRAARRVDFRVFETSTNEQVYSGTVIGARRRLGPIIDLNMERMGARNGATYRFELRAFLSYAEEYLHEDGPEGWVFSDAGNEFGFEFTINSTAPALVDAQVRYVRGAGATFTRHLDLYFQSNHYLMGKTMATFNRHTNRYESIWTELGIRPLNTARDAITRVSYQFNQDMWDDLVANDFRISTRVYDFAFNSSLYELDLFNLMTAAGNIGLADIGQHANMTNRITGETISVLMDQGTEIPLEDVYVLDQNGNRIFDETGAFVVNRQPRLFPQEGITIRQNQNVPLRPALTANENFWLEDVFWHSSNTNIIDINWDGQIVGRSPGTATLTVGSYALREAARTNPSINYRFDMPVRVLSQREEYEFGFIDTPTSNFGMPAPTTTGLQFTDPELNRGMTWMNAGEEMEVEISALPWFASVPNLFDANGDLRVYGGVPIIEWDSLVTGLANVHIHEDNPLRATVVAARGTFTPFGRYGIRGSEHYIRGTVRQLYEAGFSHDEIDPGSYRANQVGSVNIRVRIRAPGIYLMAFLVVGVRPEFVVENGILVRYHGCHVPMFSDADLNDDGQIENVHKFGTIVIPSNINIRHIGWGAFNSHPYITRVVFPERFRGTPERNFEDADYIGILEIRGSAFAYMPNLREVFLPSTLEHIGGFAFAGYNSRIIGSTTSLTLVDFSRIRAPISIGQASFQNQTLLGTRGNHWIYSFENNPEGERVEFRPGIILRNSRHYIDDGSEFLASSTMTRATDARWVDVAGAQGGGHIDFGDWRWHSLEGPAHDALGNITDPSDTFYFRWEGNPVNGGTLVPGAFDMTRIITFSNHAFASSENLRFVDLTQARAMNNFAFVGMGSNAGASLGGFMLMGGRHQGATYSWNQLKNDVSVIIGPETYLHRGVFAQSGINTPLVLHNDKIPELAFALTMRIPSVEFTGRDIVIEADAFDRTWATDSFRFTGRYELNGTILNYGDTGYGVSANWVPASVETIASYAFTTHFGSWWGGAQNALQIYVNSVTDLYFAEDVMVRRIESEAFVGFWLLGAFNTHPDFYMPNGIEYLGRNAFVDFDITAIRIREGFGRDRHGNPVENINLAGAFGSRNRDGRAVDFIIADDNNLFRAENGMLLRALRAPQTGYEFVMVAPNRPITNFVFPSEVTSISAHAFASANITNITIPAHVTLTEGMFRGNTVITSVTIEGDRAYIPANMFDGATALNTVNFENADAVVHIRTAAFRDTAIQNISFPNLRRMDSAAFMNSSITEFNFGAAFGSGYVASEFLVDEHGAAVMVAAPRLIASSVFEGTANLVGITIVSEHITTIGARAFANSGIRGNFENAHILEVGNSAFLNTRGLAGVSLPAVREIGNNAFRLNDRASQTAAGTPQGNLTALNIPNVEVIGNNAFFNQDRPLTVSPLNHLTMLGAEAFMNTNAQQGGGRMDMPLVRGIGDRAFMNNDAITIFEVGSYLGVAPEIDEDDIHDPFNLGYSRSFRSGRDLIFINGRLYFRTGIFSGHTFRGLGRGVFAGTRITGFIAPNNDIYEARDGALFRNLPNHELQGAQELLAYPVAHPRLFWTVPEGVVRIDDNAFRGNRSLGVVILPSTLTSIGDRAFFNTNIHTYRFNSFIAPRLESSFIQYTSINLVVNQGLIELPNPPATRQQDISPHVWAVYANFHGYFTPGESSLIRSTTTPNVGDTIALDYSTFIYNPISARTTRDHFVGIHNDPRVSRLTGTCFGLTIERPMNALGFDSFMFTHYFANENLLPYVRENSTVYLVDMIDSLDLTNLTLADEAHINDLRGDMNAIRSQRPHQLQFISAAIQTKLDDAVAIVGPKFVANATMLIGATTTAPQDLNVLVDAVPTAASFNAANTEHLAALNAALPLFNATMSNRPHYLEFVTNADRIFAIERARFAANFLALYAALPSAAQVTHAHLAQFNAARAAYVAATAGRPHLNMALYNYRAFIDTQIGRMTQGAAVVRFLISSGVNAIAPTNVVVGNIIIAPAAPVREGYVFVRWTFRGEAANFSQPIAHDMTFIAEWRRDFFTVTFDSAGGSAVTAVQVAYGSAVAAPTAPTREGYRFVGWYLGEQAFNFATVLDADITLTARWESDEFECDGCCDEVDRDCGACGAISMSDIWPAGLIMLLTLAGVMAIVFKKKQKQA